MPAPISRSPSRPQHIWLRAETRANERRSPLLPVGAAQLIADGHRVTVEDSPDRCIPTDDDRRTAKPLPRPTAEVGMGGTVSFAQGRSARHCPARLARACLRYCIGDTPIQRLKASENAGVDE